MSHSCFSNRFLGSQ